MSLIRLKVFVTSGQTGFNKVGTLTATDADRTSPNNDVTYSITPTTEFSVASDGTIRNTVNRSRFSQLIYKY